MNKNTLVFWISGAALFVVGLFPLLTEHSVWPPFLIFLGCALIFLPLVLPAAHWKELFDRPIWEHTPLPDEPLSLARLFMAAAWVARHFGILELHSSQINRYCSHPLYQLGKSLVIDGRDPDYVRHTMAIAAANTRQRMETKVQIVRLMGVSLFFTAIFGGLTTVALCIIRYLNGNGLSSASSCLAVTLSFLLLMGSVIFYLLIPGRLHVEYHRDRLIQQQIRDGWLSLQRGAAPETMLEEQFMFLSEEHRKALAAAPLLKEMEEGALAQYREDVIETFNRALNAVMSRTESEQGGALP